MPGRQFAHLAGPDQEDLLPLKRTEYLLRQIDGNRGHRNRGTADLSLAAHPFRNAKGILQQLVEAGLCRSDRLRDRIGFLHLAQNLRLADHHRVQARRHAKKMPHGVLLPVFVDMRTQL